MSGYDFGSKDSGSGFNFPDTNSFHHKKRKSGTKKPSHPHGVGGFFGNLIDDVKDSALGLPMGLVNAFEHPLTSIKQVANAEWQTWSPLVQGHPGTFAKNFYDHPLAPILDVAAVFTGGASLAGKVGFKLGEAGLISRESKLFKAGETVDIKRNPFKLNQETGDWERMMDVPTMVKSTKTNPLTRAIQVKKEDLMNTLAGENPRWKFSPDSPVIGANTRYRKLERKHVWSKHAGMTTQMISVMQGARDLAAGGAANDAMRGEIYRTIHDNFQRHADHVDGSQVKAGSSVTAKGGGQYRFVKAPDKIKALNGKGITADAFEGHLENIGSSFVTTNVKDAMRHADGSLMVVPKHTNDMLDLVGKEGASASRAMKYIYHKPTQIWKFAVLGLRPAFLVNNAVGNYFMYMMANGGSHAARGYVDALRNVWGDYRVAKDMGKTERWLKNMNDPKNVIDKHFLDQMTNSFADATFGLPDEGGIAGALAKGKGKLRYGLYPLTHAVSDRFLRRATIYAIGRSTREVRLLMKDEKLDFHTAYARALEENPTLRNRISEKVNDSLGDYHNLNKVEQHIRNVVPFYTWDRAIIRHGGNMLVDRPVLSAYTANLGRQGVQSTEEKLGEIPHFLRGVIPLGGPGDTVPGIPGTKKRIPILTTQGLNPYATVSDLATAGGIALLGKKEPNPGEALSTINPLITGGISFFTGQDIVSGAKVPKFGNPFTTVGLNVTRGLPQVRIASAALPEQGFGWDQIRKVIGEKPSATYTRKGSKKKIDALYSKSWQEIAAAYLGIPVKELSPAAGRKRAGDEAKAMTY